MRTTSNGKAQFPNTISSELLSSYRFYGVFYFDDSEKPIWFLNHMNNIYLIVVKNYLCMLLKLAVCMAITSK